MFEGNHKNQPRARPKFSQIRTGKNMGHRETENDNRCVLRYSETPRMMLGAQHGKQRDQEWQ